ncbi:MAG: hypothetical protein OEU32_12540 [Acidimicrobiia bacterium]|nr:hypothetical protein [Acidimicrobiia bacterium]
MTVRVGAALLAVVMIAAACGSDSGDDVTTDGDTADDVSNEDAGGESPDDSAADSDTEGADADEAPSPSDDFVGLTVDEAEALADERGQDWRIRRLDGEDLLVTSDFVEGRLNFDVEDDVVVAARTDDEPTS